MKRGSMLPSGLFLDGNMKAKRELAPLLKRLLD